MAVGVDGPGKPLIKEGALRKVHGFRVQCAGDGPLLPKGSMDPPPPMRP